MYHTIPIERPIRQKRYFVLHAPRQTGKTICLMALMNHLNAQGRYQALYVNIEHAQAARNDIQEGIVAVAEATAATEYAEAPAGLPATLPRTCRGLD